METRAPYIFSLIILGRIIWWFIKIEFFQYPIHSSDNCFRQDWFFYLTDLQRAHAQTALAAFVDGIFIASLQDDSLIRGGPIQQELTPAGRAIPQFGTGWIFCLDMHLMFFWSKHGKTSLQVS